MKNLNWIKYRIASEIPLNGESVDSKELYFNYSIEYLNDWQDSDCDLEIRFVTLWGYNLKSNDKIEMGLDYRVNSYLDKNTGHSFWVNLDWFIEL